MVEQITLRDVRGGMVEPVSKGLIRSLEPFCSLEAPPLRECHGRENRIELREVLSSKCGTYKTVRDIYDSQGAVAHIMWHI